MERKTPQTRVLRSAAATLTLNAKTVREAVTLCAPVRRIVTIHSGNLSELLFTLPALRALRETFPGAHLTGLVRENLAPLLKICPFVDEVLARPEGGLSSHAHLMARLHAQHCDVALCFSTSRNGTLLALSSGAHNRIGFDGAKMDALLTVRIEREASTPFSIEDYLDLTRALGCAPRCHDYNNALIPEPQDVQEVTGWLGERGLKEFILLAPHNTTPAKRGARGEKEIALWTQAACELSARASIVLIGERPHRTLMSALREYSGSVNIFDSGGVFDWPALASLCARAKLLVGVGDTIHLAAAMSTPVVVIGAPNGSETVEPRGVAHRILKTDETPEEIKRAALELIGL